MPRFRYSRRALHEFTWFKAYYETLTKESHDAAMAHFFKLLILLHAHPEMGRPAESTERRSFSIPKTPFTLLYRKRGEILEIGRLIDQRSSNYLKDVKDWLK